MSVHITMDDILRGRVSSPAYCPVALAVGRAQGGGVASVYYSDILTTRGIFETPEEVCQWMSAFDNGKALGISPPPFTFTLKNKTTFEEYPMPNPPWPRWLWRWD